MAKTVAVMGRSGTGKTTSLRNLDPETTVIFDADGKGLAWRGWRRDWSAARGNYFVQHDKEKVLDGLRYVNESMPNVRCVVIDTLNAIMVADESKRRLEKGYDKWAELAWAVMDIIEYCQLEMSNVEFAVFLTHEQTDRDESGYTETRILTSGRKLEKICIESKMNSVLRAKRMPDGSYAYVTREEGSTAKDGMCGEADEVVPADIALFLSMLHEFDSDGAPDGGEPEEP